MTGGTDTERRRIAYFSDSPFTGGAEKYLFLLASHLDRGRFEPLAIIDRAPGLDPLRRWMRGAGVPVHEVPLGFPSSPAGFGPFVALLRRLRPAILHLNLPGPFNAQFSLLAPLARFAGVRRVVSTEHLPMVPTFFKGRLLKRIGTRWIVRVITVSEDNRGHLTRIHGIRPEKVRVVSIGLPESGPCPAVDLKRELGLPADAILLVIAGALEERKGHDTAFEALRLLPDRFHLAVVGEGEMRTAYERTVRELGLERRIRFLGRRDDVAGILRGADLLVHPSRLDATPYVIVEALAAGLPVVASRVYGIPELIEDGVSGVLVPPGTPASLASAVRELTDDPARLERIGAAARRRYESAFTLERCVGKTIEIYEELLGRAEGRQ